MHIERQSLALSGNLNHAEFGAFFQLVTASDERAMFTSLFTHIFDKAKIVAFKIIGFVGKLFMAKKPPPASIGAKLPTLGEQFGRLEDRIQKIGGQPLPAPKNPRRK